MMLAFCALCYSAQAQTAKELVGRWKLVKHTKDGKDEPIKEDTYQVFAENGKFTGIVGSKSSTGKWRLSDDGKELTVKVSIVKVKFVVESFDAQHRVISSESLGTLEYEKVPD